MVSLERPARVVVKLEVQQGHHGHGLEVKVPLEILAVIFAAMVTDIFLTGFTPLLVDRITRVEYGPFAEMLLIASLPKRRLNMKSHCSWANSLFVFVCFVCVIILH